MNTEFWKNKKALITDNNDFKGSWLSKVMLNSGVEVYGYALENKCSESIFNVTGLEKYNVIGGGDYAKNKLGFNNKWNISEAVKYSAIWYKSQLGKMDINAVTDNILKEYFEK